METDKPIGWRKFALALVTLLGVIILTGLGKFADHQANIAFGIVLVAFVLGNAAEWFARFKS